MRTINYTKVVHEGEESITVFLPGVVMPLVAHSSHPSYNEIVARVEADIPVGLEDLFTPAVKAATYFEGLSERVSVANGRVYFDGDEVNNSLSRQIVRFLEEGVEDWTPLVDFYEKLSTNPNPHSRNQLYDWLSGQEFAITDTGDIVAYKGVTKIGDKYVSGYSGKATVNGEVCVGQIPTYPGAVIEMPRSEVQFDPSEACSTGLHAGTYQYARGFANGALLRVLINPRDVVSVPTDSAAAKIRVCRYYIDEIIDAPDTVAVYETYTEDKDYCPNCGEFLEENGECPDCNYDPVTTCDDPDCSCHVWLAEDLAKDDFRHCGYCGLKNEDCECDEAVQRRSRDSEHLSMEIPCIEDDLDPYSPVPPVV